MTNDEKELAYLILMAFGKKVSVFCARWWAQSYLAQEIKKKVQEIKRIAGLFGHTFKEIIALAFPHWTWYDRLRLEVRYQ